MKANILLVDDYPPIRDSIGRALRLEGWEVVQAVDGEMALLVLTKYPIDLIILDLEMPGMDGRQTLLQLAATFDSVPVVVITGKPGEQGLTTKSGVAAVLEKPFEMVDLLALIDRVLRPVSGSSCLGPRNSRLALPAPVTGAEAVVPGKLPLSFVAGVCRCWVALMCSPRLALLLLAFQKVIWR